MFSFSCNKEDEFAETTDLFSLFVVVCFRRRDVTPAGVGGESGMI